MWGIIFKCLFSAEDISRCHWHSPAFPPAFSPSMPILSGLVSATEIPIEPTSLFLSLCCLPVSWPHQSLWGSAHTLKLREMCSYPLFCLACGYIKKCVENMYNFIRKKACFVVLNQAFLRVLTFQSGDVEIFCLLWWIKTSFCQENDVTLSRAGVLVFGVFLLMFLLNFPYAVSGGVRKRMVSRKSILGYLLWRKDRWVYSLRLIGI